MEGKGKYKGRVGGVAGGTSFRPGGTAQISQKGGKR